MTAQQRMIEALKSPESTLYQNRRGDVLISTPERYGLGRTIVYRDGEFDTLCCGPVTEPQWTPVALD